MMEMPLQPSNLENGRGLRLRLSAVVRLAGWSWIVAGMLVLWIVSLPLFVVFRGYVQNRWMLQDTPRQLVCGGAVAALFFLPMAVALIVLARSKASSLPWRTIGGWALCSALSGWHGGPIALNLGNHVCSAAGQAVELKAVKHSKQTVSLRIVGDAYDGITFTCGTGTWRAHLGRERGTVPGVVYRGRLGLLWSEFRDK